MQQNHNLEALVEVHTIRELERAHQINLKLLVLIIVI